MPLTDSQTILLMTSATFFRRIQIAAIRVSATVRDEVVDGVEMPLERHNARFGLASRFQSNSFSMAQTFAPSVAVALSDFLDWPAAALTG